MPLVPLRNTLNKNYNPRAYVPGGSTRRVAQAIQARGRTPRFPTKPSVVPRGLVPRRPGATMRPGAPPVDPLMTKANETIFGLVNPLIQRLAAARAQAEASARTQSGAHAAALEGALGATAAPIGRAFDQGIQSSAAVNEAVANRLGNVGQAANTDLAAKLAQIGAAPVDLAGQYRGAGNAEFAHGSADLSHLIGRRAEAQAYTGKLPQIARLESNRDLQSALSQIGGRFNEQEVGLQENALNQAYDLWGQLRGEKREDAVTAREERQAIEDRRSRERMALQALRATAQDKAQERAYDLQLKQWERGNEIEDSQADRDFELRMAEIEYMNSAQTEADKRAWDAKQAKIQRDWQARQNRLNRTSGGGGTKSGNDTWQTPGSAKRARVVDSAWNAVTSPEGGWKGVILKRLQKFPGSPDAIINTAINQALKAQGITNVNSAQAKQIRTAIRQRLSGRTWKDAKGNEWAFEA